ncbi:MAG: PAS domain S-box protein, partial [Bacteroidia bacterium]|nr:PAS domain S-box protein [Bacteroidia bacterium]
FISVSESATKLFRMTEQVLLDIGPLEVSPEYQPDGRLSSEAIIENLNETIAGNKPSFEWMHCDSEGNLIPCEVWLVRLPSENKILIRGSIIDITERKKAQEELEQSYREIRQLTEHIQNIREEERIGIAREIHDELGQLLTVLKMDISWLKQKLIKSDVEILQKVDGLLKLTDDSIKSVRKISSDLRPSLLDDLGLVATMEWHLSEFEKHFNIKTSFFVTQTGMIIADKFKIGIFRIFQESLTNVARHSNATEVKVKLQQTKGKIILSIEDDGKGFDKKKTASKKTLGILGMKERTEMMGGEYQINSSIDKGTTVLVAIPE